MTYWHGGGLIRGDWVEPPSVTGVQQKEGDPGFVYVTTRRSLAASYAAANPCPWLYEVEPVGGAVQNPGSILPVGVSLMCPRARIVRRFKPSKREVEELRSVVGALYSLDIIGWLR